MQLRCWQGRCVCSTGRPPSLRGTSSAGIPCAGYRSIARTTPRTGDSVTPIRCACDTAPFQLEPTPKHVSVSAACEVALVTCCHQNIASRWHGDNLAAARSQFLHQIPVNKLTRLREHEGVSISWGSIWRTLEPRAYDFECVKFMRHGIV